MTMSILPSLDGLVTIYLKLDTEWTRELFQWNQGTSTPSTGLSISNPVPEGTSFFEVHNPPISVLTRIFPLDFVNAVEMLRREGSRAQGMTSWFVVTVWEALQMAVIQMAVGASTVPGLLEGYFK